mgnify:FL=1
MNSKLQTNTNKLDQELLVDMIDTIIMDNKDTTTKRTTKWVAAPSVVHALELPFAAAVSSIALPDQNMFLQTSYFWDLFFLSIFASYIYFKPISI